MWGLIGDDMLEDFFKDANCWGDAIDRRCTKSKANTTKIRSLSLLSNSFARWILLNWERKKTASCALQSVRFEVLPFTFNLKHLRGRSSAEYEDSRRSLVLLSSAMFVISCDFTVVAGFLSLLRRWRGVPLATSHAAGGLVWGSVDHVKQLAERYGDPMTIRSVQKAMELFKKDTTWVSGFFEQVLMWGMSQKHFCCYCTVHGLVSLKRTSRDLGVPHFCCFVVTRKRH